MVEIRKLSTGDRILDYRILENIGEGGFGQVFRAEHEVLKRVVAIKVPRDLEALSALRMEGVIQAQLDHPSIVKTLEISISHDPPYVAMEYVAGESLRRVLERGALPWRRAARILLDISEALAFAHAQGVIHGDIKPGNVLIPEDRSMNAKITDFGLGRVYESSAQANLQISRSLNFVESATEVAGTLRYLAPEVQRGEAADERADIYAIGLLLFEALTGTVPEGRELPSDIRDSVPEGLDDLFCRCYVRKSKRLKSMSEVVDALRSVIANDGRAPKAAEPARVEGPVLEAIALTPPEACLDAAPALTALPDPTAEIDLIPSARELEEMFQSPFDDQDFAALRIDLWSSLKEGIAVPEGAQALDARGFDVAFGLTTDGDPQHRVFASAVPCVDGEVARRFVEQGTRIFELEKGLWEKEVTFVLVTESVRERDKVDWALRSFSTGWWRRRRVVLYDISNDRMFSREYGCDPTDNELKKAFLTQLQATAQSVRQERENLLALHDACCQRSSRLGTALTVFSTFCVLAVGLTFQSVPKPREATPDGAEPASFVADDAARADAPERLILTDEPAAPEIDAPRRRPELRIELPERGPWPNDR